MKRPANKIIQHRSQVNDIWVRGMVPSNRPSSYETKEIPQHTCLTCLDISANIAAYQSLSSNWDTPAYIIAHQSLSSNMDTPAQITAHQSPSSNMDIPAHITAHKSLSSNLHIPAHISAHQSLSSDLPVSWPSDPHTIKYLISQPPITLGHAVVQLVEALPYKLEGRGFDSWWCHWNFSLT